ncbi:MAG: thiamine pyrophosphate-binding protein [Thermoanaerobaculales bacterium]|jgi:acetolactate synthase-1/2/3 large subunit|nr:thiamine pyrophosphate-binding protein [Thermoanaerobaculales bacterium]
MKQRAAREIVRALEDEGVRYAFGIPGTHNIELYDVLAAAARVQPVLVTSEVAGAFLADGYARSSGEVGVINVVPGAGVAFSLAGIAEAWMDNVPMVVLASGIRTDTGMAYQLHAVDQLAMLRPVTKAALRVERADELYPTIRRAFQAARSGTPGPVAVELPAQLFFLRHELGEAGYEPEPELGTAPETELVERAAAMLAEAAAPALYLGKGAAGAAGLLVPLAEQLGAPVTSSFSGKGVFPESHPLWLWSGFGRQAPPFVQRIMAGCDCLLAIGCRFGEVTTAGFGIEPPENLIHVDIDPEVFNRNFPAKLAIRSDARLFLEALGSLIEGHRPWASLAEKIAAGHADVMARWRRKASPDRVSPHALFEALQRHCRPDAIFATDSGNGTFLAVEHLRLEAPGRFLAPTDFSCMGYSVPAAVGACFAHPGRDVVALPGDGAFLMTGLELITAAAHGAAPLVCVLRDGTLSQIAQFQKMMTNRVSASVLPPYDLEGFARTTGSGYFRIIREAELDSVLPTALQLSRGGTPALVEVAIDYSQSTYFTKGAVKNVFSRLPWGDRVANVLRAVGRRLF